MLSRWCILLSLLLLPASCSIDPELSCDELEQRYREALLPARGCSPLVAAPQCSERVDSKLACPCPLMVNPANIEAMRTLRETKQRWQDQGCAPETCPAIGCFEPQRGFCTVLPDDPSIGGRCENDTQ